MVELDVLVIGGGAAGLSAAVEAARSGFKVEVVEQRGTLGGAIHRQPIPGIAPIQRSAASHADWKALEKAFSEARIPARHACVFLGVDGDGLVLIENRHFGTLEQVRTKTLIIATGAVEKVRPRAGWQLAGVSTAGGLQLMMKETGQPPKGRVLIGGTGPLLIAVAAQMTRLGNPPVAIIEEGDPLRRPGAGIAMFAHPEILREAAGYLMEIYRHRIPWLRGTRIEAIERADANLRALIVRKDGQRQSVDIDRVGLHDGIQPNDFSLPNKTGQTNHGPIIVRAGDCREALGVFAAQADGRRAGRAIAGMLSRSSDGVAVDRTVERARKAQSTLSALFAPVQGEPLLSTLPEDTILCRCEGKTVGDLRQLCDRADKLTGREVKHNGRFAMGACQGRFCAANTAQLMAEIMPDVRQPSIDDLTGHRWPLRPVSIAALTGASPTSTNQE